MVHKQSDKLLSRGLVCETADLQQAALQSNCKTVLWSSCACMHTVSLSVACPSWLWLRAVLAIFLLHSAAGNSPTLTNRLLYLILFIARPLGFFFFSCFATFGVCPRTLPARAKDPCTLPATNLECQQGNQQHLFLAYLQGANTKAYP